MSIDATRAVERALSGDLSWLGEPGADADAVIPLADRHGVAALLWHALDAGQANTTLRDRLYGRVRADVAREMLRQPGLARTLSALATADVPALVVKGTALAYTAYSAPWLRPRLDTDVLVPNARLEAAAAALVHCGYARSEAVTSGLLVSHQAAFERHDETGLHHVIDLHWKIVNPQVLANALSFEDLWNDRRPVPALGPDAYVPAPVKSLVLGCIHRLAHHHGHERLVWLYDFAQIARGLSPTDWEAFAQLACERGIAGLCLDGLQEARDRLAAPLPPDVESRLVAAAPGEASRIFLGDSVRKRDVLVSDLAVLGDWPARIRLLREHAFPPAAFMRQRYGVRARAALPFLYLYRLVSGALRWVRA
jgi:hypothetical protein